MAALEEAVAFVRADPDARMDLSLAELLDEPAPAYADMGRFAEAVRTMRAAVDAGAQVDGDMASPSTSDLAPTCSSLARR